MPGVSSSRLGRPLQRESQGVSHGVICNDSADPGIQPNDHICRWLPDPLPQTYLFRFLRMLTHPSTITRPTKEGGFETRFQDLHLLLTAVSDLLSGGQNVLKGCFMLHYYPGSLACVWF